MRNKLLDVMRFFAAFMVVLIHAPFPGIAGQTAEALSRVAVPLFFMISGYYAVGKSKEKLLKSAKKTGIMLIWSVGIYFAWGILVSLYKRTTAEYLAEIFSTQTLVDTIVFNNGVLLGHLWFLLALLYCYLIYAFFIRKIHSSIQIGVSAFFLISFFAIREILKFNVVSDPVYYLRNFLFIGMPFFLFGCMINFYKELLMRVPNIALIITSCIGVIMALVERFCVGCCDLYIGTVITVVPLFIVVQKPKILNCNILAELGEKHAGNIYIFHSLVISILTISASIAGILYVGVFTWLKPILVFVISICVSCVKRSLEKIALKNKSLFGK